MKNTKVLKSLILFSLLIVIIGTALVYQNCTTKPESYKPRALGAPGEVLIVAGDTEWFGNSGVLLKEILETEFPGLPQVESLFKGTRISHDKFIQHFKTYRNIIRVIIQPNTKRTKTQFRKDVWAFNQRVIDVIASNEYDASTIINEKQDSIKQYLYNGDISSLTKSYNADFEPGPGQFVDQLYSFKLFFPKGYTLKKTDGQFSWFVQESMKSQCGIFVYRCSLDSIPEFSPYELLKLRNKVLFEQVPGEFPGSFMTTEEEFPVSIKRVSFAEKNWFELRGLWKVQGDFMGGPFLDYFYLDNQKHQIIMLEGYVYAPTVQNKSLYIREVEALIKTYN